MLRAKRISLALGLILMGCACAHAKSWSGPVIRVVDGDTFVAVRGGSERVTVYLTGVDAPERGQAGSAEARRFLETLLLGKQVLVEESSSHRGRAGFVTLFNTALSALPLELKKTLGQVNLAVVAAGMGWWLHQESPPAPPERVQDDSWVRRLAVAEIDARRMRRGLWAEQAPVPPWQFRRSKRTPP